MDAAAAEKMFRKLIQEVAAYSPQRIAFAGEVAPKLLGKKLPHGAYELHIEQVGTGTFRKLYAINEQLEWTQIFEEDYLDA